MTDNPSATVPLAGIYLGLGEHMFAFLDATLLSVFRQLAQSPEIYCALSQRVMPRARLSADFALRKFWLGYIVLAVLFQGWIGHEQTSIEVPAAWMLATAAVMWAVVAFFRMLPDEIRNLLDALKFSSPVVVWLRGDLSPRSPERAQFVAPSPGDGDPARPLQLRI